MIEYRKPVTSLTEEDKKAVPTRKRFCIGKEVPVEIHLLLPRHSYKYLKDGRIWNSSLIGEIRYGSVTALNPAIIHAGRPQPRGLFLDGADVLNIRRVMTAKGGKDVTRFVKMSFGAAL